MNFLTADISQLYRRFLIASLGSAVVVSIYSFVDTIAIGQSVGPLGTAAIAAINPLFGVTAVFAILCGIGGSVLCTHTKAEGDMTKGNAYFTVGFIMMSVITLILWIFCYLFREELFLFFGSDMTTLPYALEYGNLIILGIPAFTFSSFLAAFIRNDGAPSLAMKAVIIGGCFNVFGDWLFCFPMDMGMFGAALATVLGTVIQTLILISHFFNRDMCTLKLVKPQHALTKIKQIITTGFGSSILDLGTVVLAVLMNNQILTYGGVDALSVYGVLSTIAVLFQALFSGVGQAVQPLLSANYGAKKPERIHRIFNLAMTTVVVMSSVFILLSELFPTQIVSLFTMVTPSILELTPRIFRLYSLLYLGLGINVLATYYLQSTMANKNAMVIAVSRSIVVSSILLVVLPLIFDLNGVLLAMPISETLIMIVSLALIKRRNQSLIQ